MCKCKCHCSYCYNCKSHKNPIDLETAKPWLDRIDPYYCLKYNKPADLLEINMMIYRAYQVWYYYQTGKVL